MSIAVDIRSTSFLHRQMGAQAVWAVFPPFLAGTASRTWIAVLRPSTWAIPAMRFVDRFDPARMVVRSALSACVRGLWHFHDYLQLVPVQVLLSIAWSCCSSVLTFLLRKR